MAIVGAVVAPHPPLIVPAVGRGEEKQIAATAAAYQQAMAQVAAWQPQTVVVISPHATAYADYFHLSPGRAACGDLGRFGAPQVRVNVQYDQLFTAALEQEAALGQLAAGTLGEREAALDHGSLIPLWFLQQQYADFQVVRLGLSGLGALAHYRLGQALARVAEALDRRVAVVASGDLSHKLTAAGPYGFAPQGAQFDRQVMAALAEGDLLALLRFDPDFCDAAAECGLGSFQIMAGALDGRALESAVLSYEGPFGVGYGVAVLTPGAAAAGRDFGDQFARELAAAAAARRAGEDAYVRLARYSLEQYVRTGQAAALPEGLPEELLARRAGAFVSLKLAGRLRGCIGTTEATAPSLAAEIMSNAVAAGTRDPRFQPVTEEELAQLVYSVDVLGQPEPIQSAAQLEVRRYGVIVERGGRRGLLLPDLAGVDTVAQQVEIAKQKAGIAPDAAVRLWRFEVVRHR